MKNSAAVTQLAAKYSLSREAYIADQAYVIRVELSHLRIKKAQHEKLPAGKDDENSTSHPTALLEMYKLSQTASKKGNSSKADVYKIQVS